MNSTSNPLPGGINIQNWTHDDQDGSTPSSPPKRHPEFDDYVVVHFTDGVDDTDATGKSNGYYWNIYVGSARETQRHR